MTIYELAARFPGGKWRGNEYDVCCPAHDDRHASLSLSSSPEGKLLLCCQAGCDSAAVLARQGLSWADLANGNGRQPAAETVYRYDDEEGNPLYEIVRTADKRFLARLPGTKTYKIEGQRRVLYGLPELLRTKPGETVGIAEGEKDVATLRRHGIAATTNPGGASKAGQRPKWKAEYGQWLKQHLPDRRFAIFADNDEAGRAHAAAILASLIAAGIKAWIVTLDGLSDKGDITDWMRTHDDAALQRLLVPPVDHADDPGEEWTDADLIDMEMPEAKFVVPGYLPQGLTVLAGGQKFGKSWMALGIAAAVGAGGKVFGEISVEAGGVLYLALEDTPRRIKKRLHAVLGTARGSGRIRFRCRWPRVDAGGLQLLREWLAGHPDTRLVIIDVMACIRPTAGRNGDIYQADMDFGHALKAIADDYQIGLLVLHHISKRSCDDPFDAVSGTIGVTGAADTTLLLRRKRGEKSARLFITGRDIEEEREMALEWNPHTAGWVLAGTAEEYAQSAERKQIITLLKENGAMTPAQIAVHLKKNSSTVRTLLTRLCSLGLIRSDGHFYYAVSQS